MGFNDFLLNAVGSYYDNEDGSSRQDELRRCEPGEPVILRREPDNRHDPSAVAVFSAREVQVGYLSANRCGWIGSKIDRGYDVRVIVDRVKGLDLTGATLGLVLRINMEGDEPELDRDWRGGDDRRNAA